MEVTSKSRVLIRLQNYIFLILFLSVVGLLAWLSVRYSFEVDWTGGGRNTLSVASTKLLEHVDGPVKLLAFATENELTSPRKHIAELVAKYQNHKSDIELEFINPETDPQRTRNMGIQVDGEVVLEYGGRSEHVKIVSEENLTNALQRLLRSGERNFVFITGHGERSAEGNANHDLSEFTRHLQDKGMNVRSVNLAEAKKIPENIAALVIAGPRVDFLEAEVKLVIDFVAAGGNLLWLHEPGPLYGLEPLAKHLGLNFAPGMIVDPTIQSLGVNNPSIALVTGYPTHPITNDFFRRTLYPQVAGILIETIPAWQTKPFVQSAANSWSETGPIQDVITFDEGEDVPGPLPLGVGLTREQPAAASSADPGGEDVVKGETGKDNATPGSAEKNPEQRIVVMGDGDFLSNTFLGNVGNQDMGFNIFNWLSHDDTFISIPAKTAGDAQLELSETGWAIIGVFLLFVLPGALLVTGITIWWRRRKR